MIILLLSVFFLLALLRVPIGISLALSAVAVFSLSDFNMLMIPQRIFASMDNTPLMAIPGFVLAGAILTRGGISKYLIECLESYLGHIRGGLAVVTVLACTIFAAISGSSPATAAAIGTIMIPALINAGYDKNYSMGLVAAGGTLGILIPPSVPLILYGVTAEQSIGKLFMAGVLPGLMMGLILIISALVVARIRNYGGIRVYTWAERWKATKKAFWGGLLPFIILGSIYMGVCTPTEAAVLSAVYALLVSVFVYKELKLKDIHPILRDSINITSMVFLIIGAAMLFALYLTNNQVPQKVAEWIVNHQFSQLQFFVAVSIMYLIMGMFLESVSIILITVPILLPIMSQLGVNPIHFGIVLTVNMELAMITPPVGLNLFVVTGVAKDRMENAIRGVMPFIVLLLIGLVLIIALPKLSLYLPGLMK